MIAVAFVVLLAGAIPPCWKGMARGRGRGRVSRAKVQEGLSRNLGDPNCSTKKGWRKGGHGDDPETSGPVVILPLWSFTGGTNKEGGWWYR